LVGGLALAVGIGCASFAAGAPVTTVSPPGSGTWRIVADRSDTPGSTPIYDFEGSFVVNGGHVTHLTGTIVHTYPHDEGCVKGMKVAVAGSQPIVHVVGVGFDSYQVAKKAPNTYVPVLITLTVGKQKVTGTLSIHFNSPGQTPTGSSLTFDTTIGCHLQFDVTH